MLIETNPSLTVLDFPRSFDFQTYDLLCRMYMIASISKWQNLLLAQKVQKVFFFVLSLPSVEAILN